MASKKQNRRYAKKKIRQQGKKSDAKFDSIRAPRRNYGQGLPK